MKRTIFALVALAVTGIALGQVTASLNISWSAPLTAVDGSALTGSGAITGYNIYVDTAPVPDAPTAAPAAVIKGTATTTVASLTVANNATLHVRAQACNVSGCGPLSPEVTKVVTVPVPGVPTNVTIVVQIK